MSIWLFHRMPKIPTLKHTISNKPRTNWIFYVGLCLMKSVVLFCMKNELFSGFHIVAVESLRGYHLWFSLWINIFCWYGASYKNTHSRTHRTQQVSLCLYIYSTRVSIPKELALISLKAIPFLIRIWNFGKTMPTNACCETLYTPNHSNVLYKHTTKRKFQMKMENSSLKSGERLMREWENFALQINSIHLNELQFFGKTSLF